MNNLRVIACLGIAIFGVVQAPTNKGTPKNQSAGPPSQTAATTSTQRSSASVPDHTVIVLSQKIEPPIDKAKAAQSSDDIEIQRQLARYTKNLVWVGIGQAVVLALTLIVIWRQASLMKTHADHLKSLASAAESNTIAAGGQLKAMQDQLEEMESSGKQTAELVEAAKKNADAALLNAQAVINSERPWVVIFVKQSSSYPGVYTFSATNQGKTPAEIVACYAVQTTVDKPENLPSPPDYGTALIPPVRLLVPGGPQPDGTELDLMSYFDTREAMQEDAALNSAVLLGQRVFVFYFKVVYRFMKTSLASTAGSVFPNYESRMCFWYTPKIVEPRIGGPAEYNEHT